ncbi:MAG: GspE/PulE family protein [Pseudomonadota bacterium]
MPKTSQNVLDNIGKELVEAGLISADQLAVALETQKNLGGDLGHILMKKGFVTEENILEFLSQYINIPFVSLKELTVDSEVTKVVPLSLARKYHFMPLSKMEDTITVAMADPLDVFAIDEIRAVLKCRIRPVLASGAEIDKLVTENYRILELSEGGGDDVEVIRYGADAAEDATDHLKEIASGAKVVAETSRIIRGAIKEHASDIHIEPQAGSVKVRNRIDGVLEERITFAKNMHLPIVTRIKIMSGMDIAERRVPQDGRVRLKVRGVSADMRVSTFPTMHGEKVVIRLLSKDQAIGLETLGFMADERKIFEEIISRPHGIFLVTGPTGSGKTTTLYAALQKINSQDKNLVSIEDPIENEIIGVSQAQVNIKAGMTFASALRSILRQDPDVIMVGEIRDSETADIAVRAAITGHLVFSTIHTNTAIGSVGRMHDLGVEPFMIASGIIGVMSQRLVRRVCPHCSAPVDVNPAKLMLMGIPEGTQLKKGKGCKNCRMSGFSGRVGLFELISVDAELRKMIISGVSEDEMTALVRKRGVVDLREQGRRRVMEGLTTIEEVLRVTEERD